MKIVEALPDFPKKVNLKGVQLEAYQMLQNADPQKPVIKIAPDGQNVAALKRAFAAAAKVLGGSVETRNGDDGTIFVRWSASPSAHGRRGEGSAQRGTATHSEEAVQREARRLWQQKGGQGSFESEPDEARRKLLISAKRNLSRASNR